MIPMKRRQDFLATSRGKRAARTTMVVQARRRESSPEAPIRIGYTASRRVGNAVIRNRAKRRLRAAAALTLPRYGKAGWDYVLIARAERTATRPFVSLIRNLSDALREVHAGRGRRRKAGST